MRPLSQVQMFSLADYISLSTSHGYPIFDDQNLHIKTKESSISSENIAFAENLKNSTIIKDDNILQ